MSGTTAQIVGPDPPGLDVDAVLQRLRQQQMGVRDPAVAPLMQKIKEAPPAAPGATPDAAPLAPGFDRFVQQESGGQQFGQDGKPLVPKNFAGDQNDPPTGAAQVRPSTARDALAKIGQPLDLNRLNTDKAYNVWVGNLIHNQLLQQYGNNAMLAAAAYNAGPGAVDSWIKQFGDPRKGEISNEDFAARIPYDETRLYVHAVGAMQGGMQAPSGGKAVDLPFNTKKIFDDLKENMFGAKQEESSALAALNESMAKLAEPPPTQEPTPAGQQWAGAAMALAAVGGLLTHRPFTTAANAMAATMTAVNEGRQAEAKQALEQWKAGHEALIAVTNYRMSLYEAAMKKYQNAPNEAKAELEANAAALQDTAVQDALSKGDVQTAMAIISGGYAAAVTMQRESAKFQQQVQDRLESQRLVNDLAAARATKDPDKIAAAQQALQDHLAVVAPAATALRVEIPPAAKPGQQPELDVEAVANDTIAKQEKLKGAPLTDAEKAQIRITTRNQMAGEKKKEVDEATSITDDAAKFVAQRVWAGDERAMTGMARSATNMTKVTNAMLQLAQEQHLNAADLAAKIADFGGVQQAERTLGVRLANMEVPANEVRYMAPIALQRSQQVDRTQYPNLNSILQAAETRTGDPSIVQFGLAANALIYSYAKFLNPQGIPTDADKAKSAEILSTAWTKGQFAAAVDQIQNEIKSGQASVVATRDELHNLAAGRGDPVTPPSAGTTAAPTAETPPVPNARKAPDGKWYVPDPQRPGKYLMVQ